MVMVRVSETYDLSTKIGKMGLVGIHTPDGDLIDRMWSGLIQNYKYMKFLKCDVAMACASMLPADPLQVGVEAGSIAPQDLFNPILYKAVSNDSMSNLQAYLQSQGYKAASDPALLKGSIVDINDTTFRAGTSDSPWEAPQDNIYYSLLANPDGWKKAMPQSGLNMSGLYPLVYSVVSNYGQSPYFTGSASAGMDPVNPVTMPGSNDPFNQANIPAPGPDDFGQPNVLPVFNMRGPSMRMPRIPTTTYGPKGAMSTSKDGFLFPENNQIVNAKFLPPCYVAMIVLPPAKLNQLYYRLKVTWTIEFSEPRPNTDIGTWGFIQGVGDTAYGSDYAEQSSLMESKLSMVDTNEADVNKIMEGTA